MAAHSSILAWKIPWTEEPGGLVSMGLQRVRHDWVTPQGSMSNKTKSNISFSFSFVLSLVLLAHRGLCLEALSPMLPTRVPAAKQLHRCLSSTGCVQKHWAWHHDSRQLRAVCRENVPHVAVWSLEQCRCANPWRTLPLPHQRDPYKAAPTTPCWRACGL